MRIAKSHKNFFEKVLTTPAKYAIMYSESKGENLLERWQLMKYYDIENVANYEEEMAEFLREIAEEEEKGE